MADLHERRGAPMAAVREAVCGATATVYTLYFILYSDGGCVRGATARVAVAAEAMATNQALAALALCGVRLPGRCAMGWGWKGLW